MKKNIVCTFMLLSVLGSSINCYSEGKSVMNISLPLESAQEWMILGCEGKSQIGDWRFELMNVTLEESDSGDAINLSMRIIDADGKIEKLPLSISATDRSGRIKSRKGIIVLKRIEGLDENFYRSSQKIKWWFELQPLNALSIPDIPGSLSYQTLEQFIAVVKYSQLKASLMNFKQEFTDAESFYITDERDDSYEIMVSRKGSNGYTGGTEAYRVDKQNGTIQMLWHEHPMRMPAIEDQLEIRDSTGGTKAKNKVGGFRFGLPGVSLEESIEYLIQTGMDSYEDAFINYAASKATFSKAEFQKMLISGLNQLAAKNPAVVNNYFSELSKIRFTTSFDGKPIQSGFCVNVNNENVMVINPEYYNPRKTTTEKSLVCYFLSNSERKPTRSEYKQIIVQDFNMMITHEAVHAYQNLHGVLADSEGTFLTNQQVLLNPKAARLPSSAFSQITYLARKEAEAMAVSAIISTPEHAEEEQWLALHLSDRNKQGEKFAGVVAFILNSSIPFWERKVLLKQMQSLEEYYQSANGCRGVEFATLTRGIALGIYTIGFFMDGRYEETEMHCSFHIASSMPTHPLFCLGVLSPSGAISPVRSFLPSFDTQADIENTIQTDTFKIDLELLRKHNQKDYTASSDVMQAAERVFAGLEFIDCSKTDVLELLGKPAEEKGDIWIYTYHDGERGIFRKIIFKNNRVIKLEVILTQ